MKFFSYFLELGWPGPWHHLLACHPMIFPWNSQSQASHEVIFPVLSNEGLESPHRKSLILGYLASSPKHLVTLAICHMCQTHYFDFAPRKNLFLHILCVCLFDFAPKKNLFLHVLCVCLLKGGASVNFKQGLQTLHSVPV